METITIGPDNQIIGVAPGDIFPANDMPLIEGAPILDEENVWKLIAVFEAGIGIPALLAALPSPWLRV